MDEIKIILDDLKEMKQDIKTLLIDVAILKFKSSAYGMLGASIILLSVFLLDRLGVIKLWN